MPKEAAKELDNFIRKKIIIGWIVNPKTNFSLLEGKTHAMRLKSEMGENFKYIEIGRGGEDKKGSKWLIFSLKHTHTKKGNI